MPFIFRKIRQSKWLDGETGQKIKIKGLESDEIPGDPLSDFATKNGILSIYVLENNSEELIHRVSAAIAATSTSLSNVDYAIFEIDELDYLNFELLAEPATTPDHGVNKLHYDIVKLSTQALVRLVALFWLVEGDNVKRVQEKIILQQIVSGVSEGYIEKSKIKIKSKKLLDKLR